MKKFISLFLCLTIIFSNVLNAFALETSSVDGNHYTSYVPLSDNEISELLDKYEYVTVYNESNSRTSGTHSTYTVTYDKTTPYGYIGYHPDTGNWDTATGYVIFTSKTTNFSIEVSANVTKFVTIKVAAGTTSTTATGKTYEVTEVQKEKINSGKGVSRLEICAKVRRQMWHYKVYENTTGVLINEFDQAYVTTWNVNNEVDKVSYRAAYKDL